MVEAPALLGLSGCEDRDGLDDLEGFVEGCEGERGGEQVEPARPSQSNPSGAETLLLAYAERKRPHGSLGPDRVE